MSAGVSKESVLRVVVLVALAVTAYRYGASEARSSVYTNPPPPRRDMQPRTANVIGEVPPLKCPPAPIRRLNKNVKGTAKPLDCPAGRLLKFHKNFKQFILNTFETANNAITPRNERPIEWVFSRGVWPNIYKTAPKDGLVLEFGVWRGDTLAYVYETLEKTGFQGYVAGFDSFAGLPTKWRAGFNAGHFGDGQFPFVKRRFKDTAVNLHKGWFQETLPVVLEEHPDLPITHLHVDGDLFVSAVIPLQILTERIRVGSLITFDELYNYPEYEQHEILALYLWMGQTGAELCAVANRNKVTALNPKADIDPKDQSITYQVTKI